MTNAEALATHTTAVDALAQAKTLLDLLALGAHHEEVDHFAVLTAAELASELVQRATSAVCDLQPKTA